MSLRGGFKLLLIGEDVGEDFDLNEGEDVHQDQDTHYMVVKVLIKWLGKMMIIKLKVRC